MRSLLKVAIATLCVNSFAHANVAAKKLNESSPQDSVQITSATGTDNLAAGVGALSSLTSGERNVAFGNYALQSIDAAHEGTAVGVYALNANKSRGNTAVGYLAGSSNTTGLITAMGWYAGRSNTTGEVTAFGSEAASANSTGYAVAFGRLAGGANTSGNVTAFGWDAAGSTSTGYVTAIGFSTAQATRASITALGYEAAYYNTTGAQNDALGNHALYSNTTGSYNLAVGGQAGLYATGDYNTMVGVNSGLNIKSGSSNVTLGLNAGSYLETGNNNIMIGAVAANSATTSSNNIMIGLFADSPTASANNVMDIANAIYATNLSTSIGSVGTPLVGIANKTPTYPLDVTGDMNSSTALRIAGTSVCTSAGCTAVSDERLKTNVQPLENSLDQILKLQAVSYDWKDKAKYGDKEQIGLIAQEVEKVFPQVVVTDAKTGLKSVAYDHLVAPLIETVKTLHDENVSLKQENLEIKARLEKIEKALASK